MSLAHFHLPGYDEGRTRLSVYGKSMIAGLAGVALGLAVTYVATLGDFPFGAARTGPWVAWPRAASAAADPYARAIIARRAEIPLGNGEGVAFVARHDDEGRPLTGSCEYRISGSTPVARLWTLDLFTPEGALLPPGLGRRSLSSDGILRSSDGAFSIVIAPSARAGNWLDAPARSPFAIALNLYDTSVSPTQSALEGLPLLSIRRETCQ